MIERLIEGSEWDFGSLDFTQDDDLLTLGADLKSTTLLAAYAQGLFPMGVGDGGAGPIGWWSPQERGVFRADDFRVTRSLRQSAKHFDVTFDRAFRDVVKACANPERDGAWITPDIQAAYGDLHDRGWAHSVEVWQDDALVGGLYGLALGGLFAGESMFHRVRDASKVALWNLVTAVFDGAQPRLIDTQWLTPHLASLGGRALPRADYLRVLPSLVNAVPIEAFCDR